MTRYAMPVPFPGVSGFRNSSPCAAAISSTASTTSRFCITFRHFRAAIDPMELWSSWLALVGIESTLAGCESTLFSDTILAAVYCAIIRPEFSPPSFARKRGSPLSVPFTRRSVLRSEMLASSESAIAIKSIGSATGCPWKLPPSR